MARTSWRHVLTLPYQANAPIRREIPVSGYIRRFWLKMRAVLDVTVEADAALARNPGTLIPNLTIFRNGEEVLKMGRWNDWIDRSYMYYGKIPTQLIAALAVAEYPIRSFITIPFITPMARQPQDTVLSIGAQEKLEIEVQWRDEDALVTGGTKAFTTDPEVRILAEISRWDLNPVAVFKETSFETSTLGTVANADLQIPLVTGPLTNYHSLLLVAEDNVADSLRTLVDEINTLWLQSNGGGRIENIVGPVDGIEQQYYIDTMITSVPGVQTGLYPLPFQGMFDGMASFAVSTAGLSDLRLIVDHGTFDTDGYIRILQSLWEPMQKRG